MVFGQIGGDTSPPKYMVVTPMDTAGGTRTEADRMCAVARYNHISSNASLEFHFAGLNRISLVGLSGWPGEGRYPKHIN